MTINDALFGCVQTVAYGRNLGRMFAFFLTNTNGNYRYSQYLMEEKEPEGENRYRIWWECSVCGSEFTVEVNLHPEFTPEIPLCPECGRNSVWFKTIKPIHGED